MDNRIEILQTFITESTGVNALNYEAYVGKVKGYVQIVFGDAEYRQLEKLDRGYSYAKEVASSMRGFLLGLVSKLEAGAPSVRSTQMVATPVATKTPRRQPAETGKQYVFMVHGHDNETKETVARFIEKLGLRVVILHEQPNNGKTIIEKFEEFANKISYAVVLLTPDDFGASKTDLRNPKHRARQNVIFELGFFVAKLGRNRVCALRKGDIELPSDYLGVLYVSLDSEGAWRVKLAKELKSVGLSINSDEVI